MVPQFQWLANFFAVETNMKITSDILPPSRVYFKGNLTNFMHTDELDNNERNYIF